jgi:hypothetical protein
VAEIGLDHARVRGDRLRRALRDDAAFGQHEHLFGEAHHRLHHMLDHHDGDAARANRLDHRHHVAHLGRVEAREHLVEQQQLRLDRERARKLQPLAPATVRLAAGWSSIGARPTACATSSRPRARRRARPRQMRADRDVLAHGQAGERLRDLERARDAAPRQQMRRLAGDLGALIEHAPRWARGIR